MYKFIKLRHDIIKQCHGNYKEMKKFNYKLEIEIFRNSTQNILGVLRGSFQGFGCPKRHPDALLAKTMLPFTAHAYSLVFYIHSCRHRPQQSVYLCLISLCAHRALSGSANYVINFPLTAANWDHYVLRY